MITDEEYTKERSVLIKQIENLHQQLNEIDDRINNWLELTEKTFDFAQNARNAFINGGVETKKLILLAIGSDFVIDSGKLEITPNEWLEPIEKGYKELETEYFRLEPEKRLDNYEENRDLQPIRVKWGGRWWLDSSDGWMWLDSYHGREWLSLDIGRKWLKLPDRHKWLKEPDGGHEWLGKFYGMVWLRTDDGEAWFRITGGNPWINRENGNTGSISKHISEDELLKNEKVTEILDKTGKTTLRELTKDNLDKAYRALSKKYLPDKHNNESNEEKERAAEDLKN
ncbi:hypothetical protein AGMMS49921_02210 [Endomicrobiia bacterium]|nr:hypothetical protein AGMMS49921_02210 [Endomicrobiia bacterium]